ncbi:MAG: twin-arginine translocation signal domain-containing protein [Planctomycetales bacterium]|nr:twin-arginine translocation signal domain-containing protein [Planctomycetales bacterium]
MQKIVAPLVDRRQFLQTTALAAATALAARPAWVHGADIQPKSVAGVVTIYRKGSHADVIIGKILAGWEQNGGPGPALRLASLYVDQFPDDDLARSLSKQFGFPIYTTIREALTLTGNTLSVDGVLSIGEHGDYPWNDKEQHLYPRRRFFAEITDVFAQTGQGVPVFSDKHLGPQWDDARWMYDRARELRVPFMAGSSLPVSFRKPDVQLPMNGRLSACLAVGYSGLDVYGFHTLEFLQCFLERRFQAEQGVEWVQCLPGSELARLRADGTIDNGLLEDALNVVPRAKEVPLADVDPHEFTIFLVKYLDGLLAPVLMLNGYAAGIGVAMRLEDGRTLASYAEERREPYPHFANLLKGIERMIHTRRPAYPVERTLLTAGILDRLLTSRAEGGRRRMTPELAISYQPVDYPFAPHIDLLQPPV